MKILAISGSLRRGSYNTMALKAAVKVAQEAGAQVEIVDLKDYPMPVYDHDIEEADFPEIVEKFKAKVAAVDGLLIASPEYNHSLPGVLKNVIDWASRKTPQLKDVFAGKTVGLITASDGSFGGVRAQIAWQPVFRTLGLILYPTQQPISNAQDVFDENGQIVDEKMKARLEKFAAGFVEFTQKHTS